ncbi:hypothetical protein [Sphingomonas turrisvirgatae]|nr:hypothetical protein [Sphingomonas turrisvirgatae]
MPRVQTYDQNVVPLAQTTRERFASAPVGGVAAGIAAGLQQLGQTGADFADTKQRIFEEQQERAAKEADNQWETIVQDAVDNPETGFMTYKGQGAVDALDPTLKNLEERADEIKKALPSELARRLFQESYDQKAIRLRSQLSRYVAGEHRTSLIETADSRRKLAINGAAGNFKSLEDSESYIATAKSEVDAIGKLEGWEPPTLAAKRLETESEARKLIAGRLTDVNPDTAEAYVEQFKGRFTAADLDRVNDDIRIKRNAIAAEQRRVEAEQRAAAAAAKAEAREAIATDEAKLANGAGKPEDWERIAQRREAIGDTSGAVTARTKGIEMAAALTYKGQGLPQLDARIAELTAKQSKGGLTPAEAAELKGVEALRTQTAERLNGSGGAMAQQEFATGQAMPALNPRDPASFSARSQFAIAAAQQYGRNRVEPLTAPEAASLKELITGSQADRLKAAQFIRKFPDVRAQIGAAYQIAGEDAGFRQAIALSSLPGGVGVSLMRDVLNGPDALKANPKVWSENLARVTWAEAGIPALRAMGPDYVNQVSEAAKALYASAAARDGVTEFNEERYKTAIQVATGAHRRNGVWYGGFTTYQGQPVSVPPSMSSESLMRRFARATGPAYSAAALNGSPVWPDGSAVASGDLRKLTPVRVREAQYGFRTRNGSFLASKKGGPWLVDARRLPDK